jgi:hypothetical protein
VLARKVVHSGNLADFAVLANVSLRHDRPFHNRPLREIQFTGRLVSGVLSGSLKTQCCYCLGDLRRILSRCYIRAGWDDRPKYA